jgi:hypothetical protein
VTELRSALKGMILFAPEIFLCGSALIVPNVLNEALLSVARYLFRFCSLCIQSNQFLLSSILLLTCLLAHLARLGFFEATGDSVFSKYCPSIQETLLALIPVIAYSVFLEKSLDQTSAAHDMLSIGIGDVIGASVTSLALVVILSYAVMKPMKGE